MLGSWCHGKQSSLPLPRHGAWFACRCLIFASVTSQTIAQSASQPFVKVVDADESAVSPTQHLALALQRLEVQSRSRTITDGISRARLLEDQAPSASKHANGMATNSVPSASKNATDNAQLIGVNSTLSAQLSAFQTGMDRLKNQSAQQKSKYESWISTQKAEIGDLHRQVTNLSAQVKTLGADKSHLEQSKDDLQRKVEHLTEQVASISNDKKVLGQNLEHVSEEVKVLKSNNKDLTDQITVKANEHLDLVKREKKALEQNAQLKAYYEGKTSSLKRTIESLHQRNDNVTVELANMTLRHQQLAALYADPSVQHFLRAKAVKVYNHPGVKGAAQKAEKYVLPSLRDKYNKGNAYINASEDYVYKKLNAYVGNVEVEPWLPAVSGFLVYGTVIIPLICTMCCLTRVVCKLKPCLLFCHLYFTIACGIALAFAIVTGKDPLFTFAEHDGALYLFAQAVFAIVLTAYGLMLFLASCCCYTRKTRESCYRRIQIAVMAPLFIAYFQVVWTPAMMDRLPEMPELLRLVADLNSLDKVVWVPYVTLVGIFVVALGLEALAWRAAALHPQAKKDIDDVRIGLRDDVEANAIELASLIGREDPEALEKAK